MTTKTDPPTSSRRRPDRPLPYLDRWKRCLREVPDLRWERVQRVRAAISAHAYDDDRIIERLVDRFQEDIGVLCRRAK